MSGGTISGNSAAYSFSGGGVYVDGTFIMSGGTISGNSISSPSSNAYGGGVYVAGTFTMSGGTISGNSASSDGADAFARGGGVYVSGTGTFTMENGVISGNTASADSAYGGGVYVDGGGTFTKKADGVIYGSDASASLENTAWGNSYGHAVYVYISSSSARKRNTTAGSGVTLDSKVDGSSGGWAE
jgi:hypothetical protein